MDPQRYEQLVSELEALGRTRPDVIRRRVRWLVVLGYAYLFLVLVAMLAGIAALVWMVAHFQAAGLVVKLAIPIVGMMVVILRSLWVKVDAPKGRALTPGTAPALETRVEEIRRALDAPHADTVLLTTDFNASVTQVPRLGILGWPKTYLSLGVPLMLALQPRELDAVLGHEFGHLSGAHPKLGLWLYRMSRTWDQLLTKLQRERRWGHKLFEPFVRWYAPRTQAYGFVLSRRDEYEADADAARVVSAGAMADALVALEVEGLALSEHVWPSIWRRAEDEPQAPDRCWSTLVTQLQGDVPEHQRTAWLGTALARRASNDNTHPSLKERLDALGVDAPEIGTRGRPSANVNAAPWTSAAEHYLGALTPELLTMLDEDWRAEAAEHWRERYEKVQRQRTVLADLDAREAAGEPLTSDELWTRAGVECEFGDATSAIATLHSLLAAEPELGHAQLLLGRLLLDEDDESGVAHVRRAMTLSSRWAVGASMLYEFYSRHGRDEDARAMEQVQRDYAAEMRRALDERSEFKKSDSLLPVLITTELRDRVRGAVQYDDRVAKVLIAQKATSHVPDYPMLVVVVVPKRWRSGFAAKDRALAQDVLDRVHDDSYVHLLVVVVTSKTAWLRKRIEQIAGSLVYARQ